MTTFSSNSSGFKQNVTGSWNLAGILMRDYVRHNIN